MKTVGRPNVAERLVLDYAATKEQHVIDLVADRESFARYAASQGVQRPPNLKAAIDRLKGKDFVHMLQRGRWLVHPAGRPAKALRLSALEPAAVAILARLNRDYYVSWHSALWHYGVIDQQSRRLYVATKTRKRDAQIGMASIRFVAIAERKFFGRETVEDFEWPVEMATIEKALIDSFDHPRYAASVPVIAEALRRAWQEGILDPERLVRTAIQFNRPTINRRLGFFMDLLEIPGSDELTLHLGRKHAVPLSPGRADPALPVNRRWRVYEDPAIIGTTLELK